MSNVGSMPPPTLKATAGHDLAFELSEASVRLEGLDPMASPAYVALRARVIAGEITSDEAADLLLAAYTQPHNVAA